MAGVEVEVRFFVRVSKLGDRLIIPVPRSLKQLKHGDEVEVIVRVLKREKD